MLCDILGRGFHEVNITATVRLHHLLSTWSCHGKGISGHLLMYPNEVITVEADVARIRSPNPASSTTSAYHARGRT